MKRCKAYAAISLINCAAQQLIDGQRCASNNLDKSFKAVRPRALIQMATGASTKNLGEQAAQELIAFTLNDDHRKFTELYAVQRLSRAMLPLIARSVFPRFNGSTLFSRGETG